MTAHPAAVEPIDLARVATGFANPTTGAQHAFRRVLEALSFPGRRVCPVPSGLAHPPSLPAAAAAVLLSLCDPDTRLFLGPRWRDDPACTGYLRFHAGCPLTHAHGDAHFALLDGREMPPLESFAHGEDLDPQDGATLIVCVDALDAGRPLRIDGPGLREPAGLRVDGLPDAFWQARIELQSRFPAGVDLLLVAGDALVALPRSTRLEIA